jgi:hypothetical protein
VTLWKRITQAVLRAGIERHVTPHMLPQLCHALARPWCGPSGDPRAPGPCQRRHDGNLHPRGTRAPQDHPSTTSPEGLIRGYEKGDPEPESPAGSP